MVKGSKVTWTPNQQNAITFNSWLSGAESILQSKMDPSNHEPSETFLPASKVLTRTLQAEDQPQIKTCFLHTKLSSSFATSKFIDKSKVDWLGRNFVDIHRFVTRFVAVLLRVFDDGHGDSFKNNSFSHNTSYSKRNESRNGSHVYRLFNLMDEAAGTNILQTSSLLPKSVTKLIWDDYVVCSSPFGFEGRRKGCGMIQS